MYPHERSLVKRLANEPFALIGVNSDPKENVLAALKRDNITWRSFWDGGRSRSRSGSAASRKENTVCPSWSFNGAGLLASGVRH